MASLERQKGRYRIVFRYGGQKFQRSLDTEVLGEARAIKARLEENLKLISRGRLAYDPATDDLVTIILSDGRLNAAVQAKKVVSLGKFLMDYRKQARGGKEPSTLATERIHIKHFLRMFGRRTLLSEVPARLQEYVDKRSQNVGHVTIKKELGTLSSLWNKWGLREGVVPGPLTLKNLEYPKRTEQQPFLAWEQIEAMTKGDTNSDLWSALFLSVEEIEALLDDVEQRGSMIRGHLRQFPFIYPMLAFCAHTGARRSEMLRARVPDFNLRRNEVRIREKKKDRTAKETYRHVPMTERLQKAMRTWLEAHPGGDVAFCRVAGVEMTTQMSNHHFRWAVDGSKWSVVRGWHTLRHSVVSNLICQGTPERVVMSLVGHLNRETTKRYAHLLPSVARDAMDQLFGKRPAIAQER